MLNREQVERLVPHVLELAPTWKHEIQDWLDTDAALRAENERLKSEMGYHAAKDVIEQLANQRDTLTAQLAAMKDDWNLAEPTIKELHDLKQQLTTTQAKLVRCEEALKEAKQDRRDIATEQSWKDKQGEDYGSY